MLKFHECIHANFDHTRGRTALLSACYFNKNDVVEILLCDGNADPNIFTTQDLLSMKTKTSPLMIASRNGNAEIVKILLKYKADISSKDSVGETALSLAQKKEHAKVVEILESGNKLTVS